MESIIEKDEVDEPVAEQSAFSTARDSRESAKEQEPLLAYATARDTKEE